MNACGLTHFAALSAIIRANVLRITSSAKLGRFFKSLVLAFAFAAPAVAQVTVPIGGTVNIPAGGAMSLGCTALNVQGSFNVNSGSVSNAGSVVISNTGGLHGGSGTLSVSGDWNNSGTFVAGTGSVVFDDGCTSGPIQFTGATLFNNLTLGSTSGKSFTFPAGNLITVTGTLTLQGTPGRPISLQSAGGGSILVMAPGSHLVENNANGYSVDQNGNVIIAGSHSVPQAIPTLSEYSLMLLSLMMAASALWRMQVSSTGARRKSQNT